MSSFFARMPSGARPSRQIAKFLSVARVPNTNPAEVAKRGVDILGERLAAIPLP
jgi:hypothetical protein